MNTICAVIVTYNRKELLLRNIVSLKEQNIDLDILIFDNASQDGTYEYLNDNKLFEENKNHILYERSDINLGGAGGFHYGMKQAYEKGYDFIWLMDDDGHCMNNNTLTEIMNIYEKEKNKLIIVNSLIVQNENLDLTFGLTKDLQDISTIKEKAINNIIWGFINPFNGTMITKEIIGMIGFPKKELFIYGDEIEYTKRAGSNNIRIATAINSLYFHPVNKIGYTKQFFWKKIQLFNMPIWKRYCSIRNYMYITKIYGTFFDSIKFIVYNICSLILLNGEKDRLVFYTYLAIKDGLTNNFDKKLPFDI
jgi:GT2 family glycosyltransferase